MATIQLLTAARTALWNSINAWPELKNDPGDTYATIFGQCYRMDSEMPLLDEIEPSISDLPAIAIMPTSSTPAWWTNEMQQWPTLYDVVLWTQDWSLPQAEDLIEKIIRAVHQAKHPQSPGQPPAAGSFSYVKAPQTATPPGTGYHPMRLGPITFNRAKVGGTGADAGEPLRCIVTTCSFALRCQKDPLSD